MRTSVTPERDLVPAPGPSAGATPWHALSADACVTRLDVDPAAGLSGGEVVLRRAKHGPNALPGTKSRSRVAILARQFANLLVALLAGAAVLMLALGEFVDAAAIGGILVVNAGLGYALESRAADALAALRHMAAPDARVRRERAASIVPAADLVPGDVVVLEAGDRVPADVRLLSASGCRMAESALTGESEPAGKDAAALAPEEAAVADRHAMAWMGTTCVAGSAVGVVVATGAGTEFGRIATLVGAAEEPETPLQARLRTFGKLLAIASGAVVVLVFILGMVRGLPFVEMLLTSVSLAVAAVPEGLPAIVTVALALGVSRMAKRNVLVRRLPAVETLGSTSVICTDKTGTLTVGEMTVRTVTSLDFDVGVGGEGYRPAGDLRVASETVPGAGRDAAIRTLRAAVLCSAARIVEKAGEFTIAGDPTEGALVVAAMKAGVSADAAEGEEPAVATRPFDADRKRMSVTRRVAGGLRVYVKGAPESVLSRCVEVAGGIGTRTLDDADRAALLTSNLGLASRGLRVLAVACRELPAHAAMDAPDAPEPADPESGLTLLGLVGMADPPRPAARDAVASCRAAGIRVVMITGDQAATALAIARDLGIAESEDEILAGSAVESMDAAALEARVESISVYARASPEHKLRIVQAWRARGAVVAMTGDGVNDAPALKGADIGVAMGKSGTDVAKDASAMVVTDDDFASIVAAVAEGRRIFENIRKTLLYLLSGNVAEILVMAIAVVAGWPLPLLPTQLLWINLVTDGLPALALATDPADPGVLDEPPRAAGSEFADRGFLVQMLTSGLLVTASTLAGFLYGLRVDGSVERARTYAFSILVFAEVLRAFAARSRTRTLFEVGAWSNARLLVIVAVTVALQLWSQRSGALESFLHTGRLSWGECGLTLALGAVPVTVLESWKLLRRLGRREAQPADSATRRDSPA